LLSFEAVVLIPCSARLALRTLQPKLSPSFLGEWIHFWANRCCPFSFGEKLFYGLSDSKSKCMGRGDCASLLPFQRKKHPRAFIDSSSQIRLGTGLLRPTSYSYVSRNAMSSILKANLVLCPFSTTDDHQFIQSRSRAFPALWKFIMKYKMRGQIISENNQVTFVHNYSHWKQLAQITIEPQNYYDESSITDKWRHPVAAEPGEFLSFRLALARDGCAGGYRRVGVESPWNACCKSPGRWLKLQRSCPIPLGDGFRSFQRVRRCLCSLC